MIRRLIETDIAPICEMVNENWREVYVGDVAPQAIGEKGCAERSKNLAKDFGCTNLQHYVYEADGKAIALLSFGDTAEEDRSGAFEIWRLYLAKAYQGRGIGGELLCFAERHAKAEGYREAVIWAFQKNQRAIAFYQKFSYVVDKTEEMGPPYCTDAVRLYKKLI